MPAKQPRRVQSLNGMVFSLMFNLGHIMMVPASLLIVPGSVQDIVDNKSIINSH